MIPFHPVAIVLIIVGFLLTVSQVDSASDCLPFTGQPNPSCIDCLEAGCVWTLGGCYNVCVAQGEWCYSVVTMEWTAEQACARREADEQDSAVCGAQRDCKSCVATIQSDGVSHCEWYRQGIFVGGYCSKGECDAIGCGDTVCGVIGWISHKFTQVLSLVPFL